MPESVHKRAGRKSKDRYVKDRRTGGFLCVGGEPRPLEWGEAIEFGDDTDEARVIEALHKAATTTLPPHTRYELRKKVPNHLGPGNGIAWYRSEDMDRRKTWGDQTERFFEELRYFCVGEFLTPDGPAKAAPPPRSSNAPLPVIPL